LYREQTNGLTNPSHERLAGIAYEALGTVAAAHGLEEDFTDIFLDSTVAVYVAPDDLVLECVLQSDKAIFTLERFRGVGFRERTPEA
jgi:hypothetical protein